ncbi:metal ABC transporter solute-binding protein, Zn/Mn family [Sedimenticola selenatireducens]|uniref:High-affinity zinc uptake system protein ZnuA n=1 Tax=Sedimenticola selenatireducens TaxID=191960 RepID=A0A557S522_9GAMM|nr:zinc ABC transporter substrate-binding protein [Sedimenticola selenatireducens]TVO72516.1 ABC transporter substrate-binding protein [Sedimenticola selenatireducens]TVT64771.1 MAG: ABC transporter substrate-binding protein [Sedimenticola selenatireducens]
MHLLGLLALFFGVLAEAAPLSVTVTILPQKFFVERIGGEHVQVSVLVGPGQSPETFEPLPRQMAVLSGSSLFHRIGVPFEDVWMEGLRSTYPELVFLDAREGVSLREMEAAGGHHHDDDAHHAHAGADPHIWLDPANVRIMIDHLRDQLITLDPQHAADYRENHTRFSNELAQLEQSIRVQLGPMKGRKFMVFHPSWGYFADAFQLKQLPIENEGKESGARTLMRLIDQARHESIRVIFVQQQFSTRQAEALANAINGQLVTLDPLAESYFDNMRKVASAISEAYQ